MSSQATHAIETLPASEYAVARESQPDYVKGRRDFFKYADLGVTSASKGRIRAQRTSASDGLSEPTGWHYHKCEGQFVICWMAGWNCSLLTERRSVSKKGIQYTSQALLRITRPRHQMVLNFWNSPYRQKWALRLVKHLLPFKNKTWMKALYHQNVVLLGTLKGSRPDETFSLINFNFMRGERTPFLFAPNARVLLLMTVFPVRESMIRSTGLSRNSVGNISLKNS